MSSRSDDHRDAAGHATSRQSAKQSGKRIQFDANASRMREIEEAFRDENVNEHDGTRASSISDMLDSLTDSDVNTCFTFGSSDTVRVSTAGINEATAAKCEKTDAATSRAPEAGRANENQVILLSKPKETKPVYKFQVVWNLESKNKNLGTCLRHHVILTPYCGQRRAGHFVNEKELPVVSPLRTAVERCRDKGIELVTGFWKRDHYPTVIMIKLDSIPREIVNKRLDELARNYEITASGEDAKFRSAVLLGYVAVELLVEFENAIGPENLSPKSWIRFHNWTAASGPVFASNYPRTRTRIAFLVSKTRLGRLKPADSIEARLMARALKVEHSYALELKAVYYASQLVVAGDASAALVQRHLFKRPDKRVLGFVPQWVHAAKGKFTSRRYEHVHRMRADMLLHEDAEEEDDAFLSALPKRKVRVICFSEKMLRQQVATRPAK